MCPVYNINVFSMLRPLGHILISDLVVANLFMYSLPGMILLYLATLFKPGVRWPMAGMRLVS